MRATPVFAFSVFCVGLLSASFPAFSQQPQAATAGAPSKPLVVLTRMWSPPGDTVAGALASTITDSLDLVLHLTGSVTVHRADFLDPTISFDRSVQYYKQAVAEEAVYGSITAAPKGGYAVDLEIWNLNLSKALSIHREISDLLSSFDLADELALQVGSTVVGRKLSEGTLVVTGTEKLPNFSVYADGQLLGQNQNKFRLLTGVREIIIAKPGQLGGIPLQTFHVDITSGGTTTVVFSEGTAKAAPVASSARQAASPALAPPAIRTGLLAVDVKALPSVHGAIHLQIVEAGTHPTVVANRSGNQTTPFFFDLAFGMYRINAGFEDDVTFPSYTGEVRVIPGSVASLNIRLDYSRAYQVDRKISSLEVQRNGWERKLKTIQHNRSQQGTAGAIFVIAGGLSEVAASVFLVLAADAYSKYEAATSSPGAVAYHQNVQSDRTVFYITSLVGAGLVGLGVVLHATRPSPKTVEQSIHFLDEQIVQLRRGAKAPK